MKPLRILIAVVLLALAGGAEATPPDYYRFIADNPDLRPSPAVEWSIDHSLLETVHRAVNASIAYDADPAGADHWGAGADCEEFVIAKMRALRSLGVPRGAMRIAITLTPRKRGHAVLVIGNRVVLDSNSDGLRVLADYAGAPLWWESLGDVPEPWIRVLSRGRLDQLAARHQKGAQ